MPSKAVELHGVKDKRSSKTMVSPSSDEVVSKARRRRGLDLERNTWAADTKICLAKPQFKNHDGLILFNVGTIGKELYKCVKDLQEKKSK